MEPEGAPRLRLLALLALLGGLGGLLFELAWLRAFALLFSQATHATAVLLACFLGGLATGSAAAPWMARRWPAAPPLALFALAEGLGVLLGLASGLLLPAASEGLAQWLAASDASGVQRTLAQVLLGAAAVLPPTFFLGMAFPFLAAASARADSRWLPGRIGLLQGVNTLGGAAGVLLAGFLLIPLAGLRRTFLLATLAGGAAALGAWLCRRRAPVAAAPARPASRPPRGDLLALAIPLAGAAVLAQEVVLTRVLLQVLGGTLAAAATVLAAFLLGLALGNALGWLIARSLGPGGPAARWFGGTQALAGLLALAYPLVLPELPAVALATRAALGGSSLATAHHWVALACGVFLLPMTLCMGAAYPLAVAARNDASGVARAAWPLAWSTLGSIGGSLLAGFVFIPWAGLFRAVAWSAALSTVAGALAIRRRASRLAALAAALALPLLAAATLDRTAEVPLARAYFSAQAERSVEAGATDGTPPVSLLHYAVGPSATVLVEQEGRHRSLYLNGKIVASTILIDQKNQALLAHLPLALQPGARRVLVVGLGTGGTVGAVLSHDVAAVTCAELSPEVLGAVDWFRPGNQLDPQDPRLTIEFDDARSVLRSSREPFDVITSDPVHPWVAGAASLYTEDYYRLLERRLAPDGVVAQWLPLYQMGPRDIRAVVATFVEVFPDATLWAAHHDAILVAPRDGGPPRGDLEALRALFRRPAITRSLGAVSIRSVEDLLGHLVMGPDELRRFSEGATILRDDRLVLEATVPTHLFERTEGGNLAELIGLADVARRLELLAQLFPDAAAAEDCRRDWLRASLRARQAALQWTAGHLRGDLEQASAGWSEAMAVAPGLRMGWFSRRFAESLERSHEGTPGDGWRQVGLGWSRLLHGADPEGAARAASRALALLGEEPGDGEARSSARVLAARVAAMAARYGEAEEHARLALLADPCEPEALRLLVLLRLHQDDAAGAATALGQLQAIDPDGVVTAALEARLLAARGRQAEAIALARIVRQRDPGNDLVDPVLAAEGGR